SLRSARALKLLVARIVLIESTRAEARVRAIGAVRIGRPAIVTIRRVLRACRRRDKGRAADCRERDNCVADASHCGVLPSNSRKGGALDATASWGQRMGPRAFPKILR